MPELTNIKFVMAGMDCMSNALAIAAQAVGDGMTSTCLVLKAWHNLEGRYSHGGANAEETISGTGSGGTPGAPRTHGARPSSSSATSGSTARPRT